MPTRQPASCLPPDALASWPGPRCGRWPHLLAAILIFLVLARVCAFSAERSAFRIGFSAALFTDINANDAKAGVKIWAQTIARERNIPTDPVPHILSGPAEIAEALINRHIDAITLTAEEYEVVRQVAPLNPFFATRCGSSIEEEYIILVPRIGGPDNLAGLAGGNLAIFSNSRASLALPWLDNLLVSAGLPVSAKFFSHTTSNTKLARVILPVFFHQSDACLVTKRGFDTMNELNPQLGRTLRVLATSPGFVPVIMGLRAEYNPPFKDALIAGLRDLHLTPAGQQVLTIFQGDQLVEVPAACIDSALTLLAAKHPMHKTDRTNSHLTKDPAVTAPSLYR